MRNLQPWAPGLPGKGLWLPDSRVVTWAIDDNGDPTHDQGAKMHGVDLLDCVPVTVSEDGRTELIRDLGPRTQAAFERAALAYDDRLWFETGDGWRFG